LGAAMLLTRAHCLILLRKERPNVLATYKVHGILKFREVYLGTLVEGGFPKNHFTVDFGMFFYSTVER
jgi:hypothetical protein